MFHSLSGGPPGGPGRPLRWPGSPTEPTSSSPNPSPGRAPPEGPEARGQQTNNKQKNKQGVNTTVIVLLPSPFDPTFLERITGSPGKQVDCCPLHARTHLAHTHTHYSTWVDEGHQTHSLPHFTDVLYKNKMELSGASVKVDLKELLLGDPNRGRAFKEHVELLNIEERAPELDGT